ncbi:transposase, partial [Lapidilactobacillus concavus]
ALNHNYPQAKFQRCLIHMSRNIMQKVRVNDRAEVANEFKELHRAKTRDEAQLILNRFIDHWESKYPRMV